MEIVKTNTAEENIRVVRRALEAVNTGDTNKIHEVISPKYFNHESQVDPVRSKLRGPEEFIDTVRALRSAFADLHYEEQEVIVAGDKVASRNFFVIPPTGNRISYQAVHVFRIDDDGMIAEHKAIRDDLSLLI
jgi:nogalonic acid methyl ester cyclase/aklanonic acid methyl ester cyclase